MSFPNRYHNSSKKSVGCSVRLFVHLFVRLSVCPSRFLPVRSRSVRLFVCPFVCLSVTFFYSKKYVCPSVCPSVCLFVRLSVCPSCFFPYLCYNISKKSVALSVCLSVCPSHFFPVRSRSVHLFVCLSVMFFPHKRNDLTGYLKAKNQ